MPTLVFAFAAITPSAIGAVSVPVPQSPSDNSAVPLPAVSPVDVGAPAPAPAPALAPAPASPAPAPALRVPVPVAKPVKSLPLKAGMKGPIVRDMQRELRRRGVARIAVDGSFGPSTARAVRNLQQRWRMPANGQANARFLKRLGLQSLSVAGVSIPAPVTVSDVLPSWVRMDVWPAPGQLTSPFGWRWGRAHEGIDIGNRANPPVVAALAGTVTFAGWESGYGNLVKINHGNRLETRYGHLSSISVTRGDVVASGVEIGIMGSTGRSTGTHLHFEVRVGGTPYNSLAALPPRAQSR